MPEHLRALVAILFLSAVVLWFLRRPMAALVIKPGDFHFRAGLWLVLTTALFLADSFWLYLVVATPLLVLGGRKDSNAIGFYAFLLLLTPPIRVAIEGFAGIQRFLDLDWLRLMAIAVLLPAAIRLRVTPGTVRLFRLPPDKFVFGYLALLVAITAQISSQTDVLRTVCLLCIDALLPYYVFSRGLVDDNRRRDTFAAFTASCAVLAAIAIFETAKGWLLYSTVAESWGIDWSYGGYMFRDSALRATASAGHSIYLGYVLMVALGLHLGLRRGYPRGPAWKLVFVLLGGGVAVSLARGPWVGAVAMLITAMALAPKAKAAYAKGLAAALVVLIALMATPLGSTIASYLPFIGKYDEGSVDYRQQLFRVAWDVLLLNPLLGSPYYLSNGSMESLRQGEGIIDLVNSYVGIALGSGLIGLWLFVGVFASSAWRLWRQLGRNTERASDHRALGVSLLSAMVGALVTIATVGSENAVPVVYWCIAGACAGYVGRPVSIPEAPRRASIDLAT